MQEQQQASQSQQKVEQFKNEIRSRMRNEYMKKIRYQFLQLENSGENKKVRSSLNPLGELTTLLNEKPDKNSIARINRIVIDQRERLTEQMMKKMISFIKSNLLNKLPQQLSQKVEINDLIALFGNILAIDQFSVQVANSFDFGRVINHMIKIIQSSSNATANLVLWILFQLTQIVPDSAIAKIAQFQLSFKQKFGLSNLNLSYLICSIAEKQADLIEQKIVDEYCSMLINNQPKYFCQNITVILSFFIKGRKNEALTDRIISWISTQLSSAYFSADIKPNLLKLLLNALRQGLTLNSLMNLLLNSALIYEIIQRSLFDNLEQKLVCIMIINEIIKRSPQMQLQQIASNYPTLIQTLVSSLSLLQHHIVIASLISIGKIVTLRPNDHFIRDLFINAGLQLQLQVLRNSKNKEVQSFAGALLDNYLDQ